MNHASKYGSVYSVFFLTPQISTFIENSDGGFTDFLDFFDKIKSQKRCEKIVKMAVKKASSGRIDFYVPCSGVRNGAAGILMKPVSASVYACFMVRYSVFGAMKWTISRHEMVLFVWWKNSS